MANKARGFVEFEIGGRKVEVALGLGALAELEDAFGVDSFEQALDFGDKISARRMQTFLGALLKGNGVAFEPAEIAPVSVPQFMALLTALTAASGMAQAEQAAAAPEPSKRPLAGRSAGKRG